MMHDCTPEEFESHVRRIARYLWPSAHGEARMISGQERDGYFETEECKYIIEATCDRKKAKAEKDANKIKQFILDEKKKDDKPIVGYLITKDDPTAEQVEIVRSIKNKANIIINIVSFPQFEAKIVDIEDYIRLRNKYKFGSIYDPASGKYSDSLKYIDGTARDANNNIWPAEKIARHIAQGEGIVLIGDYGAGKSMTLREVFRNLVRLYKTRKTNKFPMYINLREHQKQDDIDEILERHAKKLGFRNKSSLVRAWNLGLCHLILDGFDEMMSAGINSRSTKMRDIRYRITDPIRKFVEDNEIGSGILIAGRQSYFDTDSERKKSLGTDNFTELFIGDFTQEQIELYLQRNEFTIKVPDWIPSRPLLLGTLLVQGCINSLTQQQIQDPAQGWNLLLDEIAKREAKIEQGLDPVAIRYFLETLAAMARNTDDGLGALDNDTIVKAFKIAFDYTPDEDTLVLLLRLPGIGYDSNDTRIRKFIDRDFASVCAASYLFKNIDEFKGDEWGIISETASSLSDLGISFLALRCSEKTEKYSEMIIKGLLGIENPYIQNDAISVAINIDFRLEGNITIDSFSTDSLYITGDYDLHNVTYTNSIFNSIQFADDIDIKMTPTFENCYIVNVIGVEGNKKEDIFKSCDIDILESRLTTTNAIMSTTLATQIKVLISILKKIYIQKGSGRLESAFYRGLDTNAKKYVEDILRLLCSEGLTSIYTRKGNSIYLPIKKHFSRVGKIISDPNGDDNIIKKALEL